MPKYIAQRPVSIVTDQEGTTRDLVKFDFQIDGVPLRLVDSAGIRKTYCKVEALGVNLANNAYQLIV